MEGFLDELDQAFLTLQLGQFQYDFQIDTGFFGTLVIGEELFEPGEEEYLGTSEALLANDQVETYQNFAIPFHWFNEEVLVHVMVGPGKTCLIGTRLFTPGRLEIDYGRRRVRLVKNSND